MKTDSLLNQRYEIRQVLGRGGRAITYLALDQQSGRTCAIKGVSLQQIGEWKIWELAEREAKILKNLDHPQIPAYLDFFTVETDQDTQLYLVQDYVTGHNLSQLLREGRHFTESEAIAIALGVCGVLEYLQRFSPPIIHRDIKPGNIILSSENQPFLIDFDTVTNTIQHHLRDVQGLPTIVGTHGYMPIEQTEGRAVPASDIYALGMTLIAMLSRKEPSQMEKDGLRLLFRPHVSISTGLADVLERMIAPDWHDRYQNAADLRYDLERLQAGTPLQKTPTSSSPRSWLKYVLLADLLLGIIVAVGLYVWFSQTPQPERPSEQPIVASPRPTDTPRPPTVTPETEAAVPLPAEPETASDKTIAVNLYRDFHYVPRGWPMDLSVGQTTAGGLDTQPYEALTGEPQYHSSEVLYGYFPLGNGDDRKISFVLDDLNRPHWIAYVDKNNNEDLTDDGPPCQNAGSGLFAAEVEVQVQIAPHDETTLVQPYRLWMWVVKDRSEVRFYARCHFAGTINVDGNSYEAVAFEQFKHNGLLRESGLWIDLNHDKKLDKEREHFHDGDTVMIADHYYQLQLQYP